MPAGRGRDAQRDRALLGRAQRAGAPPGDLLQRQPQRLGVGEFAVEQAQRRLQRRELLVGEGDRRQVEVLGSQRVVLLLGRAVGGALDGQLDAQRLQLGAVRVEAPRERVLVHAAVALDVAPDLQRRDGPALGHQVGDQRQLADQLLGVLGHRVRVKGGGGLRGSGRGWQTPNASAGVLVARRASWVASDAAERPPQATGCLDADPFTLKDTTRRWEARVRAALRPLFAVFRGPADRRQAASRAGAPARATCVCARWGASPGTSSEN